MGSGNNSSPPLRILHLSLNPQPFFCFSQVGRSVFDCQQEGEIDGTGLSQMADAETWCDLPNHWCSQFVQFE